MKRYLAVLLGCAAVWSLCNVGGCVWRSQLEEAMEANRVANQLVAQHKKSFQEQLARCDRLQREQQKLQSQLIAKDGQQKILNSEIERLKGQLKSQE